MCNSKFASGARLPIDKNKTIKQSVSTSSCAACPEQKTKEQSTLQNKKNNHAKSLQVGGINMCGLSRPQVRKTNQWWPVGKNNNNQPGLSS